MYIYTKKEGLLNLPLETVLHTQSTKVFIYYPFQRMEYDLTHFYKPVE